MREVERPDGTDWRAAAARVGLSASLRLRATLGTAQMLALRGERRAAESACRDLLAGSPDDVATLEWLAGILRTDARWDEVAELRRRAFDVEGRRAGLADADRELATAFRLAAEGYGEPPPRVPSGFLADLYDTSAHEFDDRLRRGLSYRGPETVHEAVLCALGDRGGLDVLDAGCGTGLAAPLFRSLARRLDGIDLSPRMLDVARARGLYDDLAAGDLAGELSGRAGRYDLVVAVDVLCYFGDLTEIVALLAAALRPAGHLALTVERAEGDGWELGPSRRYAHAEQYVRSAARAAGLVPKSFEERAFRTENLRPVRAFVAVFARGSEES